MNALVLIALSNVVLGVGLVALERSKVSFKMLARKSIALLGVGTAFILAVAGQGTLDWRSVGLDPDQALLCAVAIGAVWSLAGFLPPRVSHGLGGIAGAGLIFVVGADWLVPQLLFALAFFGALAAANVIHRSSSWEIGRPFMLLFLLVLGALASWTDTSAWRNPVDVEGAARIFSLIAVAVAVVPWPFGGRRTEAASPAAPLLTAAGFSFLPALADGEPYAGAAFLGLGVLLWAASWLRHRPDVATSSISSLTLAGAALLVPETALLAGAAAVLIAAVEAAGRLDGDPFRGAVLALAPMSLGAVAIGSAAEEVLVHLGSGDPHRLGWGMAALLLPVALSGALRSGIVAGRSQRSEPPAQIRGTAIGLGLSAILFLSVDPLFGLRPLGSGGGIVLLILVSASAGVAATFHLAHREPAAPSSGAEDEATLEDAPPGSHLEEGGVAEMVHPLPSRSAATAALLLGAMASVGIAWLTFQGLRVGFL